MPNDLNVKDKAEEKKIPTKFSEFMRKLRDKVEQDESDIQVWKEKMICAHNQRQGIKQASNYPYAGAPNFPLPETDKLIKKNNPTLVLSVWGQSKLCTVGVEPGVQETPELKEKARKAELAMNFMLRHKMDLFNVFELAADYAHEKGHCIFRTVELFKRHRIRKVVNLDDYDKEDIKGLRKLKNAELKQFISDRYGFDVDDDADVKTMDDIIKQFRSGKKIIEFEDVKVESYPCIKAPLPTKVIVPSYTTDIDKAERITYEYFVTRTELENDMEDGVYIKKNLDDIKFDCGKDLDDVEHQKRITEGVSDDTADKDLVRIHEVMTWYKGEGEKYSNRHVFYFLADVSDPEESLLKHIKFPYEFDCWNYDRFDNEKYDARHYSSRGIPEQISGLQEIMEKGLNNMLIRDEFNNNPVYEVLSDSDYIDKSRAFAPGEKVPVDAIGQEIARVDEKQIPDMSSERIMQIVKAYTEEYQHSPDQLFNNATNQGGGKTLGEIQVGLQQSQPNLEVNILRWTETLSKVFTKVFKIMQDRLGDSIYINGEEITREDFNFPAIVRCNGSVEISNTNLATYKAMQRLNMAVQMSKVSPMIVNQEDLFNSYRNWLEIDGAKNPDDYSTDPKEAMQQEIMRLSQQLQQMQGMLMQGQKQLSDLQKDQAKVQEKTKEYKAEFKGSMEALAEKGVVNAGR